MLLSFCLGVYRTGFGLLSTRKYLDVSGLNSDSCFFLFVRYGCVLR
uniref:Uncharacterized protein n=1 Tax=Rhizophora mucronata TaxID=61149 RepID=A0A2P2N9R1_RHIMU